MSVLASQYRHPRHPLDPRLLSALCLCVSVVLCTLASAAELPLPFAPGERLTYTVRVWLGDNSFGLDVGTADFTVDKVAADRAEAYQFEVKAKGGAFGYDVRSTLTSLIDAATLKAIRYAEDHRGSDRSQKRLEFSDAKVEYWKWVRIELPDGTKSDERQWELQKTVPVDHPCHDLLSALYLARGFDLSNGAKAQAIDVADTKKLWRLKAQGGKPEKLTIPAGTFDAIPVLFTTEPLNEAARESKFSGLFGMKGNAQIWVDAAAHRILRIRGALALGVLLNIDVSLKEANSDGK